MKTLWQENTTVRLMLGGCEPLSCATSSRALPRPRCCPFRNLHCVLGRYWVPPTALDCPQAHSLVGSARHLLDGWEVQGGRGREPAGGGSSQRAVLPPFPSVGCPSVQPETCTLSLFPSSQLFWAVSCRPGVLSPTPQTHPAWALCPGLLAAGAGAAGREGTQRAPLCAAGR